jgi:hypothetical protein
MRLRYIIRYIIYVGVYIRSYGTQILKNIEALSSPVNFVSCYFNTLPTCKGPFSRTWHNSTGCMLRETPPEEGTWGVGKCLKAHVFQGHSMPSILRFALTV